MHKSILKGTNESSCSALKTILNAISTMLYRLARNDSRKSYFCKEINYRMCMVEISSVESKIKSFVGNEIFKIFNCKKFSNKMITKLPINKWAMLITIVKNYENIEDENIFIKFTEVPASKYLVFLTVALENNEKVVGVSFSDEESLWSYDGSCSVDVNAVFFDSMKRVICDESWRIESSDIQENIFEACYEFNSYVNWDDQLNSWVNQFKQEFGIFPCILLASSSTYTKIDMAANSNNRHHLIDNNGDNPPEYDFTSMSGFVGEGYSLDFCVDENIKINKVKLIFDTDPNDGIPLESKKHEVKTKAS